MSTQNEKHNYDFKKRMVSERKLICATPVLVEELRHRLEMTDYYNTERELNCFVSYSIGFDNPGRALTLLHNCHVMRTNNGYPSTTRRIVQALKAVLKENDPTMALEKAVEKLSNTLDYIMNRNELGLDNLKKRIDGMIKKNKKDPAHETEGKRNKKGKNEKEDSFEEPESKPKKLSQKEKAEIEKDIEDAKKLDKQLEAEADIAIGNSGQTGEKPEEGGESP